MINKLTIDLMEEKKKKLEERLTELIRASEESSCPSRGGYIIQIMELSREYLLLTGKRFKIKYNERKNKG